MFKSLKVGIETIKKLFTIMTKQQKALAILLLTVVIFSAIVQTISVYAISPLVSAMTDKDAFLDNQVIKAISSIINSSDYVFLFCSLCIAIALIYFFKELLAVFQVWFSIKFAQKVQREVSKTVFDSYIKRDYDFFLGYGTAKVLRDVKEDPAEVNDIISSLVNMITELLTVAMLLIYVVISDYQMAICMAALATICVLILIFGFKKKLFKSGEEAREGYAAIQKALIEAVEGVREVKVMKKEDFFSSRFYRTYYTAQKPLTFQYIATYAPTYVVEGVFVIGMMLFLCAKAYNDTAFWQELPILASFMVAAVRMLPSIGRITNGFNNVQFRIPALNSVYDNVIRIRKAEDRNNSVSALPDDGKIAFNEKLELKGISYGYEGKSTKVISGLNLTIKKGESVGIVGQSGAGKSTMADIILGLHIPQEGKVLIDSENVTDHPGGYADIIGYVPQNVYLIDATIRENVAFGVPRDEIDDDQIISALKKAKLYEFVMSTEKKLDTIVGERGVKFSGGQRQRLAIARALYRNPQILILDEATSALDNETETAVMEQVEELQGKLTLIIIAHRLSTIEKCDVVYEIVDGKAKKIR